MPHVSFVSFAGLRVHEQRLLDLGMTLPGLSDRADALAELPGLGLLTLAGMTPDSWSCCYHEATADLDALAHSVASGAPDLVAISALTASVEEAYRFSTLLRSQGIRVVIGGLHATACSSEAQAFCDAVVAGSGEAVWLQVLADAEQGELRPFYDARDLSPSLIWPQPRFDLLKGTPRRFTLQTQRGCPLACEFCGASRLLGPFREKPASLIREELAAIGRLSDRPVIELADDNTFAGDRPLDEFFQVFADSGVRYFTESDWRLGTRPELLKDLAASGCVQVLVGIESSVFRYPGMGKKAAELEQILESIHAIQDAGVAVNGCFILGADGETHASIEKLIHFINESPFADIQLTLQTPFPGTRLYDRLKQSGRLLEDRGWPYYTLFDVTYEPDLLSVAELEQAFEKAMAEIFSTAATAQRLAIRKQILKNKRRLRSVS